MKIGIYSGTFDPIHNGHLSFARAAIAHCNLEKVFFLPEPRPRQKQAVKSYQHRVRMIELAVAEEPQLGVIMLGQQQFSVERTLPALVARFSGTELFMLFGEDVVQKMFHWSNIEKLLESTELIIGVRDNQERNVKETISTFTHATHIKPRYHVVMTSNASISSSKVRQDIALLRRAPIPGPVSEYIAQQGLYAPGSTKE